MLSRRNLILAALMAIALVAGLAGAAACGGGDDGSGPRFRTETDSFDLGVIRIGEAVERAVAFRNEGQEPLRVSIKKVRPAPNAECGCGVEGYEVRPELVEPGGSGEMVFELRAPEGMPDMQDVMLAELETNDPARPIVEIELTFRMVP